MQKRRLLMGVFGLIVLVIAGGRLIGPYFWHFQTKPAVDVTHLPPPDEQLGKIIAPRPQPPDPATRS